MPPRKFIPKETKLAIKQAKVIHVGYGHIFVCDDHVISVYPICRAIAGFECVAVQFKVEQKPYRVLAYSLTSVTLQAFQTIYTQTFTHVEDSEAYLSRAISIPYPTRVIYHPYRKSHIAFTPIDTIEIDVGQNLAVQNTSYGYMGYDRPIISSRYSNNLYTKTSSFVVSTINVICERGNVYRIPSIFEGCPIEFAYRTDSPDVLTVINADRVWVVDPWHTSRYQHAHMQLNCEPSDQLEHIDYNTCVACNSHVLRIIDLRFGGTHSISVDGSIDRMWVEASAIFTRTDDRCVAYL